MSTEFGGQAVPLYGRNFGKISVAPVSPELTALTGRTIEVSAAPTPCATRSATSSKEGAARGRSGCSSARTSTPCRSRTRPSCGRRTRAPMSPWRGSRSSRRSPGAKRVPQSATISSPSIHGTTSSTTVRSAASCAHPRDAYPELSGLRSEITGALCMSRPGPSPCRADWLADDPGSFNGYPMHRSGTGSGERR